MNARSGGRAGAGWSGEMTKAPPHCSPAPRGRASPPIPGTRAGAPPPPPIAPEPSPTPRG